MAESEEHSDVIVIGAGLAGLAAAYALALEGFVVTVLEESAAPGGRASTLVVDAVPVDLGAGFVSDFYHETMRLTADLDLSSDLVRRSQTAYVIRGGQARAIWPAPQLIKGSALSLVAKLRLLGLLPALLRHWGKLDIADLSKIAPADKKTAADYASRAIGKQGTEYFFAPLLRGLLYWDPATTSAGVVWCILKAFLRSKATYRFQNGIEELAQALASKTDVRYGVAAKEVTRDGDDYKVTVARDGVDTELVASAVVCAVPAPTAAALNTELPDDLAEFLKSVSYSATAVLTYRVAATADDYPRGAYLFPAKAVADLNSINPLYLFVDNEDPAGGGAETAADSRLLNVYLSNQGASDYAGLSDAELSETVLRRLSETLGPAQWMTGAELANVHHWPLAIPRFTVGHIKAVETFLERVLDAAPGLDFAGDYLGGPYVDGAIRSGRDAARRIRDHLPTH